MISEPVLIPANMLIPATILIPENMLRGVLAGVVTLSLVACGGASQPGPQPELPGTGLRGEYFGLYDFQGLASTQTDPQINFDWGAGSPRSGIEPDTYSVLWTGSVKAPVSGEYTFFTTSDDGVRLSVNGTSLVNNWNEHSTTEDSGKLTLTAGVRAALRLEFYQAFGVAQIKLEWSGPGIARQVVPTAVLYPAP